MKSKNFLKDKYIQKTTLILIMVIGLFFQYMLGIILVGKINIRFIISQYHIKIIFNFIMSILAIISCILSYNNNKKEEIFIISLMYIVFVVDILGSNTTGYLNNPYRQYMAMGTSFIRMFIVYISISKFNKIKEKILNNKYKSIFVVILISSLSIFIEENYMLPYNEQILTSYKYYTIIMAILYIFISIKYFKKSIKENEYIYGLVGIITYLFFIQFIYNNYYLINSNEQIRELGYSTIVLAFIICIVGLFIESSNSTKMNEILEEQSKLFSEIISENKYCNIIICDENYIIKYRNKKACESLDNTKYINENIISKEGYKFNIEKIFRNEIKLDELEYNIDKNKTYRKNIYLEDEDVILDFSVDLFEINKKRFKVIVVKDNSDKHKLEKALLEYEMIKREETLKNEFFSNISHELRTPLNVIYSTKQLLDMSLNKGNYEDVYNRYSPTLEINCKRMVRLIDNIVDITKLDTGYKEPKFKNYNIVNIIEDMTLSVANYAKSKGISIIFDTQIEELNVKLDLDMLERIMLNLLSNAIKFSNENGKVLVEIFQNEKWVGIKVIDNGIGIDLDIQSKIFDRFVQGDKSIRRKNEGSGIGLSLVKSFVELLDGEVYVKSDGKTGSEFTVLLPNEKIPNEKTIIYNDYNVNEDRVQLEISDIYELFNKEEKVSN